MDKIKICTTCGKENLIDEMLCIDCFSDISSIKPVLKNKIEMEIQEQIEVPIDISINSDNYLTTKLVPNVYLKIGDKKLNIITDTIIGRENFGKEILSAYMTVSRHHAEIMYTNNKWHIKDLNTTNGTFLNNIRLLPNSLNIITNGDELKLSSTVKMIIEIS